MKKCSNKDCIYKGKLQPLSNFYWRRLRNRHRHHCKDCYKLETKEYRKNNPKKVWGSTLRWRQAFPEKLKKIAKRYWNTDKGKATQKRAYEKRKRKVAPKKTK